MFFLMNLTCLIILNQLKGISNASPIEFENRDVDSADTPDSSGAEESWNIPSICPGGDIANTDADALWGAIEFLQTMPLASAQLHCNVGPGCTTVACTNIEAGHPGEGGSSLISVCNDNSYGVTPNCNNVGKMSQYIVGFCQNAQGSVMGSDGTLYNVTSGQLFTDAGFNVINNHNVEPCPP